MKNTTTSCAMVAASNLSKNILKKELTENSQVLAEGGARQKMQKQNPTDLHLIPL